MNTLLKALKALTASQPDRFSFTGSEIAAQYEIDMGAAISAVSIGQAKAWGYESWVQQNDIEKTKSDGKVTYQLVSDQATSESSVTLSEYLQVELPSSHLNKELSATLEKLEKDNGLDNLWIESENEDFELKDESLVFLSGHISDDDIPDEPGSGEVLSKQATGNRTPRWKLIFGELDEINPIAARIAALMSCWWHPSFDSTEQNWICDLVSQGLEALAIGDEAKVVNLRSKIKDFNPNFDKYGWVIAALIQVTSPKPLLKNPLCEFNDVQGTYSFKGGQRQPKIAIISKSGASGSGKSEFEKWLGLLCDDKMSLGEKPMAAAAAVSSRKDVSSNPGQEGRMGNEPYTTGWKGQPVEGWNKQQQGYENTLFCFSDLRGTGTDLPSLTSILKAFCEAEVVITRQDASLSKANKSWLLYGGNASFSSTRPFSFDKDDPLAEIIRRSFMVFCKNPATDAAGRKIIPALSKFQNFNWDGFSLSYVWQEQFIKQGQQNSANRFQVTKDSKNGKPENGWLVYHIQRELERCFQWEKDYNFPIERWDFIASAAAYGSVAYVRSKKWLSEAELIACYQNYFAVLQGNMQKSSTTTTELKRWFQTYINGRLAEHKKRNPGFDIKKMGLSGEEVRIGYDAAVKYLNPKRADRIPLIELMAGMGYMAETANPDGTPLTEIHGNSSDIHVRFFPVPEESEA